MLNRTRLAGALLALILTPAVPAHAGSDWQPDLGPALETARAEGKDLLIDFTGSDWCGWCHKLDAEVFEQELFKEYAAENFVLVALDFPKEGGEVWKAMPEDLRARNREWQARFGVQGFPTIMLMTPEGLAYAKTGYRPDGAGPYIQHLGELQEGEERAALRAALQTFTADADNAKGERLDAAYELMGKVAGDTHDALLETIRVHDPEDSRGVLARMALEDWKGRFLVGKEPDWKAMLAAGDSLLETRPNLAELAEYQVWMGFANALGGDLGEAEARLARVEALDDGSDRMVAQMSRNLKGLIAARQAEAAAEPADEG